jgi:hypothetical protein
MKALMIKDLAASKQLGSAEMSAVHGGGNVNAGNRNVAFGSGFASPAIVVAPVTQVDVSSITHTALLQNLAGLQAAKM